MSTAPEKGVDDARTLDRRSFFRAGGTVAAAVVIVPIADEAQAAETGAERTKARYRETEHVKNYYRVNRY
jgi:hypothetical protein